MSRLFIIAAVVCFAVDLVLTLVGGVGREVVDVLLYAGLASFAAGHL